MKITTKLCPKCRKASTVDVDPHALLAWRRGLLIQEAFPDLSVDDRELLITGTHPACWDEMFPDE